MKTLEEHNAERRKQVESGQWKPPEIDNKSEPHPNNIACPRCGAELWDSSPGIVLLSYPGQVEVLCPSCGYRGRRIE